MFEAFWITLAFVYNGRFVGHLVGPWKTVGSTFMFLGSTWEGFGGPWELLGLILELLGSILKCPRVLKIAKKTLKIVFGTHMKRGWDLGVIVGTIFEDSGRILERSL